MDGVITIDFLESFDFSKPIPFFRTKGMDLRYNRYKKELLKKGKTPSMHILSTILHDNEYIIEANHFPYTTDKNLHHYVYWIKPGYEEKHSDKIVIENINCFMKGKFDGYWCWENHKDSKSVPEIKHYQIIFSVC